LPDADEYEKNGLALQNAMVEELGISKPLFTEVLAEQRGNDVVFTPYEGGVYYGLLTSADTKKVQAVGGALEINSFADLKKGGVLYLGYLESGESITLTNNDKADTSPQITAMIYRMDTGVLEEALELLSRNFLQNVIWGNDHISGEITMEEAGRLILSVPYEEGWHIRVNGEEREAEDFGESLIALDLEPGEYEIEMYYTPEGLYMGMGISLVSMLMFVLWSQKGVKKRIICVFKRCQSIANTKQKCYHGVKV